MWARDIYIATAWASLEAPPLNVLQQHSQKIRQLTVGLHFHQTTPSFLKAFRHHPALRVVEIPHGVFHPKAYAFVKGNQCAWLIGSSNLTSGGFNANEEANVCWKGAKTHPTCRRVLRMIDAWHRVGETWDSADLNNYIQGYKKLAALRALLKKKATPAPKAPKPAQPVKLGISWPQYLKLLRNAKNPELDLSWCLEVLGECRRIFHRSTRLAGMSPEERRYVAGFDEDSKSFGSMSGHGKFMNAVNQHPTRLDSALRYVPISGPMTIDAWRNFERSWRHRPPFKRAGLATATRLAAMKRPDLFICVNGRNARRLARAVDVSRSQLQRDFTTYWQAMSQLWSLPWYRQPRPRTPQQRRIWDGRVSILDLIFYEP